MGEKLPVERKIADTGIAAVVILGAESGRSWPDRPSHPHPNRLVPPPPVPRARGPSLPPNCTLRGRVTTHPARSTTSQVSQSLQRSHTQPTSTQAPGGPSTVDCRETRHPAAGALVAHRFTLATHPKGRAVRRSVLCGTVLRVTST